MPITGKFEGIIDGKATGWAVDRTDFNKPVLIQLLAGERVIAEGLAKEPRKDLAAAGVSETNGGFSIPLADAILISSGIELTARGMPEAVLLTGGPHRTCLSHQLAVHIDGFVERNLLTGWIRDPAAPSRIFTIQLFEDGKLIAETTSNGLVDARGFTGRFTFTIAPHLLDGALHRFDFHCKELNWTMKRRSFLTPLAHPIDEALELPFLDNPAWAHTRAARARQDAAGRAAPAAHDCVSLQCASIQAAIAATRGTDKTRVHGLLCELGHVYLAATRLDDAATTFRQAIAMQTGDTKAITGLVDTLLKQGDTAQARTVLDDALAAVPDNGALLDCADRIAQHERSDTARVIAFYLPQFHPTPENDAWWGKGFTEWTNVAAATPMFDNHLQPRRPTALGYYDLRLPEVANAQFDLARHYGIDAFCYYYYWFDGRRVLDRPLQDLVDGRTGPFPFCICWANEDWTRSWDGQSGDVLLAQNHGSESDFRFIQDLAPALKHPSYLRIDGRPVVLVYRAEKLADAARTTADWRRWCVGEGIGDLHLCAVQSFGFDDPRPYGFDAAVEFPPHSAHEKYPETRFHERIENLPGLVERFSGSVFDYNAFADAFLARPREPYRLYRGCFLAWDNTARRGKTAHVFHDFSVHKYADWLARSGARTAREGDNALVFVNAWNEWAEGSVLEPDAAFGHELLEATRRAKALIPYKVGGTYWRSGSPDLQLAPLAQLHRVILVGHDAHPHGAQINLLNMARSLKRDHGIQVAIFLLEGGILHAEYEKVGETILLDTAADGHARLAEHARRLRSLGTQHAICNTVVTGEAARILRSEGFRVVSLVHEMPSLIEANGLQPKCWHIAAHAHNIVFASAIVAREFNLRYWPNEENILIAPQGITFNGRLDKRDHWRRQVRTELGLCAGTAIVMGCGYGDFRKGIDLFVQAAAEVHRLCPHSELAFVWVGALDGTVGNYVQADVDRLGLAGKFFITGRVPDADRYYAAADVFALTSREDPFPSVVMEAYDAGLPVVAFDGGGGYVDIVDADTGALVPYLDVAAMGRALAALLTDPARLAHMARHLHAYCRANFSYRLYTAKLLALLKQIPASAVQSGRLDGRPPAEPADVSVIVPNFNYARYLRLRLRTIAGQTVKPREIIVLDDASTDDSLAVIESLATEIAIPLKVVRNEQNTGNPFVQWAKGIAMAAGQFIWIAEADDYCEPALLATLLVRMSDPDCVLAWSDSIMVDEDGNSHGAEYKTYFAEQFGPLWSQDFTMRGTELIGQALALANVVPNASAALFRRAAVKEQLALIQQYRFSGDWWFWLSLAQQGQVSYCSDALNYHRRHRHSVMGAVLKDGVRLLTETLAFHTRLAACKPDVLPPSARLKTLKQLEAMYRMFPDLLQDSPRLMHHPALAKPYAGLLDLLKPVAALEERRQRRDAWLLLSADVFGAATTPRVVATLRRRFNLHCILIAGKEEAGSFAESVLREAASRTTVARHRTAGTVGPEERAAIGDLLAGAETVFSHGMHALIAAAYCVPHGADWSVLVGSECHALLTQSLPIPAVDRIRDAVLRCTALRVVDSPVPHAIAQMAKSFRKPLLGLELEPGHAMDSSGDGGKGKQAVIMRPGNLVAPERWPETARRLLASSDSGTVLRILVTEDEGNAIDARLGDMPGVELVWVYEKPWFDVQTSEAPA